MAAASQMTKMSPINLAIVITLPLLHHPHDPTLDAQLSNPNQNGGAALVVIHLITHHADVFPDKPLPLPPIPPRTSSPPPTGHPALSSNRFLSDDSHPTTPKKSPIVSVRLVGDRTQTPLVTEERTSLSNPVSSTEFGSVGVVRGKGRLPSVVGSGIVEELRRVYEERCRIVKTQEPGRKQSALKAMGGRGGMGIGIGKVS